MLTLNYSVTGAARLEISSACLCSWTLRMLVRSAEKMMRRIFLMVISGRKRRLWLRNLGSLRTVLAV